jgi:hypothetical protein
MAAQVKEQMLDVCPVREGDQAVAVFASLPVTAPVQARIDWQDAGNIGIFTSQSGRAWNLRQVGGEPFPNRLQIPAALMSVWHLRYWGRAFRRRWRAPRLARGTHESD